MAEAANKSISVLSLRWGDVAGNSFLWTTMTQQPDARRCELLNRVDRPAEHVAVVLLVPLAVQVAVGGRDLRQRRRGGAAAARSGARAHRPPVVRPRAAPHGAPARAHGTPVARVLEGGEVLDHAQEDVLAEVLQIDRRHTLAIEPADDQGAIQVRQVLPGLLLADLGAEQQAVPGLVHQVILP